MNRIEPMMITASPEVAAFIEQHGVARIFMDQEVLGKAERQGHLDTQQGGAHPGRGGGGGPRRCAGPS